LGAGSARSPKQLALRIRRLSQKQSIAQPIRQERDVQTDPDGAVQSVLDFIRLWATFHFPRLLRAMERIQRHVYEGLARRATGRVWCLRGTGRVVVSRTSRRATRGVRHSTGSWQKADALPQSAIVTR